MGALPSPPVCGGGDVPMIRGDMVTQCGSAVIAGTDEGAIIEVVTKRSNAQRQQILKAYKAHYGRVLQPSSHPASSFCPHSAPSHVEISPSLKGILPREQWAAGAHPHALALPQEKQSCHSGLPLWVPHQPERGCPFPFACPILSSAQRTPEPGSPQNHSNM